jgi:hypothetical protein
VTALTVPMVAFWAKATRVRARLAAFDTKAPAVDVMGNCDRHRRPPRPSRGKNASSNHASNSQNMQQSALVFHSETSELTAVRVGRHSRPRRMRAGGKARGGITRAGRIVLDAVNGLSAQSNRFGDGGNADRCLPKHVGALANCAHL